MVAPEVAAAASPAADTRALAAEEDDTMSPSFPDEDEAFVDAKTFSTVVQATGKFPASPSVFEVFKFFRTSDKIIRRLIRDDKERVTIWRLLLATHATLGDKADTIPVGPLTSSQWIKAVLYAAFPVQAEVAHLHASLRARKLLRMTYTAIQEYIEFMKVGFAALATLDEALTESTKFNYFKENLPAEALKSLILARVFTVDEAEPLLYQLATLHEFSAPAAQTLTYTHPAGNQPPKASGGPARTNPNPAQKQKMTPAERERCRAQGLCFYCRQPDHLASNCPNKPPRPAAGQRMNHADAVEQGNE